MAGIPPFAGFVSKFMLFGLLLLTQKYTYIVLFSVMNLFSIYFYIQNTRFLIRNQQANIFLIVGFYSFSNKKLFFKIVFMNFFNLVGLFFFEDVISFFKSVSLLKKCV